MLKRQRAASPRASALSDVPLLFDDSSRPKRRRILPPALDGNLRGRIWENGKDDGEEEYESVDEEGQDRGEGSSEYKAANSMLHELHALNRHRQASATTVCHQHWPYRLPDTPPGKGGSLIHLHHNEEKMYAQECSGSGNLSADELQKVTERYEETNKLSHCFSLLTATHRSQASGRTISIATERIGG
ncbi:uncharacterized protein BT62DRAFT_1001133 [Guyanagaster necrorhizus]|uniref:Uncharacterized protein n=1 Tax=Guyanagaster necrorhizus TaxID=856835 RepID=A0A9P8AW58_9AGAR|nr:uncharacterized protein BT62DRAFT_1001133 [Guyanagaster necrorhizus MCA 3950]KAG7450289.1 hypothetical protein BT62DRAFT_1001133 [Guyanagaster necrorhizus MCA 3950]